jgi:aromatic-L-amino-acid decarboxylase
MSNKNAPDIARLIHDETFDIDTEEFTSLVTHAGGLIVKYFETIRFETIIPDKTLDQMKESIIEPLPLKGQNLLLILEDTKKKVIDQAVRIGHPKLLGWMLPSGTPIGAVADGIAGALNQNVALSGSGIATAVELLVLDWIKQIVGFDQNAAGILVSGGTLANLTALTVARNSKATYDIRKNGVKQGNERGAMVLYVSKEVHSCILKAANLLGLGTDNIRFVDIDDQFRLDVKDLEAKIIEDKMQEKHPFCVVATAGTVNTGAIDRLDAIADICQNYNLWFHVDAAYGGFAALAPSCKPLLKGITRADSLALDPHKWLFIPFEAGCVFVKNAAQMREAFSVSVPYLHIDKTKIPGQDDVDFADYGIQLSRQFRALKIWMSLKQYGIEKYGRIIEQNVHLAQYLFALLLEREDVEIVAPPALSTVCFRYYPRDLQQMNHRYDSDTQENIERYLDALNQSVLSAMRKKGKMMLSGTVLRNTFVLRACIVNFRTTKQDIVEISEMIQDVGKTEDGTLRRLYI